MKVLGEVCSSCRDKPHRCSQIYRLFLSFLLKMRRNLKREEFMLIVSNPHYLNALLCLTTLIFNYAYKTQ